MMQWKKIFCAVLISAPIATIAQDDKPTTDGKQLALLEENRSENVTIAAGSKVVKPDSLLITIHKNDAKKPDALDVGVVDIEKEGNGFKHVPLIGELDYYGKMNGHLVNYCKSYFNNFSRRLNMAANDKGKTLEVMDNLLQKSGIPKELKYLAVIESALNGNARSPAGAVGYWQFMAPTARMMGLTVNKNRDDRKDLYKSTQAAAKYLSYLYDMFDDWLLVIAAYNSGPRPVINAKKRTGKEDFWSLKPYLPKETQNHVMAFVATATIMERLQDYIVPGLPNNFDWASLEKKGVPQQAERPQNPLLARFSIDEVKKMAIVRIDKPLDIELLSSILSVDRRLLGRWNYDYYEYLENYGANSTTFNLRIPKDKLDLFIEKKSYIERYSSHHMRL